MIRRFLDSLEKNKQRKMEKRNKKKKVQENIIYFQKKTFKNKIVLV